MNSPRIRHFVEPTMSVVDRNVRDINEARMIMTTTALPLQSAHQGRLELLVSRLAVTMLRWSRRRTQAALLTHSRVELMRANESAINRSVDPARLSSGFRA